MCDLNGMVERLFELWRLTPKQQDAVLALDTKYSAGELFAKLFGIHRSLRVLFPYNEDLRYGWMSTPNRALDGLKPVEMVEEQGIEGLELVRSYLDSALLR